MLNERRFRLALMACMLAALVARLYHLGSAALWLDEALEWQRATGQWPQLIIGRPLDLDPPLYPMLLRVWTALGDSEAWLRLPSVVLGVWSVWLTGAWLAPRVGRRVAAMAALGMALAPALVHYGQELNQYSALVMLTIALYGAAERVLAAPPRAAEWRVLAAVSVVGLFTFYGFAVPLAAVSVRLICNNRWRTVRRFGGTIAMALLVLVALGLWQKLQVSVVPRRWGLWVDLPNEWLFFKDLAWHEVVVFMFFPFTGGAGPFWANVLGMAALAGALRLWRSKTGRDLVVWTFLVPLILSYALRCLGLYPLGNRYGLYLAPPMLVGVAAAMDGLARRWRPVAAASLVATLTMFVLFHPQRWWPNPWLNPPREDMRTVTAWVSANEQPGDRIEVNAAAEPAFRYYRRGRPEGSAAVIRSRPETKAAASPSAEPKGAARLWLVLSGVDAADQTAWLAAAREELGHDAAVAATHRAENAAAYLFSVTKR